MSTSTESIVVPEGFKLHTENTSHILLPSTTEAFLNPVQEFNRDLSVACIKVWSEEMDKEKEKRWRASLERRAKKAAEGGDKKRLKLASGEEASANENQIGQEQDKPEHGGSSALVKPKAEPQYRHHEFVILEALSATGLRSIRYAKEIPLVKYVIANDLSSSAVDAMKRNIDLNGLGAPVTEENKSPPKQAKVRVNEGDACALMYNHREEKKRVDVVDLDPYGTAAPFVDASVQCINDGGLLCVTCTDLAVLATTNYPEKCFSNYGGIPIKSEYCHEAALRLVLHTISTSAARYGRYIKPVLSLSIDFYVRLFVRVHSAPIEVKKAASKTSTFYVCSGCQSHYEQPLGRIVEKPNERTGGANYLYKTQGGPPVSDKCPECHSSLHVAGPMWSGGLHDPVFVQAVLDHLSENEDKYGTSPRMRGMLTVAKEELETPFYFTPGKVAGFFHSTCPSLEEMTSALLHAGHNVSRSHAVAGSLKTTATRADIHDIFRSFIDIHPVKMENIAEGSPARVLLSKEPKFKADFSKHPKASTTASKVKLVRYQQNPTPNWGPGTKASSSKRKRPEDE